MAAYDLTNRALIEDVLTNRNSVVNRRSKIAEMIMSQAIVSSNLDIMRRLMTGGKTSTGDDWVIDVNTGVPSMMDVAACCGVKQLEVLLAGGVNIFGEKWAGDANCGNGIPLYRGVTKNNVDVVRFLLKGGYNVHGDIWMAVYQPEWFSFVDRARTGPSAGKPVHISHEINELLENYSGAEGRKKAVTELIFGSSSEMTTKD